MSISPRQYPLFFLSFGLLCILTVVLSQPSPPPLNLFSQLLMEDDAAESEGAEPASDPNCDSSKPQALANCLRDERMPLEVRMQAIANFVETHKADEKSGEVVCTLRDQWIGKAGTEKEARYLAFKDCFEGQTNVFQVDCIAIKHEIACE